ncbi:tetratricopeptide repeat-containing sulfotransferase family protein [Pseudanabaena sp. PCC 6802]|uniref:tetratricopeptide repeat-containing sulfotransferase family protein n=1 Tax=Pseudanabaena sp. PCC 6802 TaxID=118173 RepID=UPI0003463F4F|nr:tetratricopeptide repeat-containing sulfotransferase family protein [Pseudanabaena sp. PCC 6802]
MNSIPEVYGRAVSLHQAGNLVEAEKLYRQILEQEPQNSDALNMLGVVCHQMNKYNEAISSINRAISINNQKPAYYFNLGKVQSAVALSEDAIRSFKLAIAINPNYFDAYVCLGNTYRSINDLEQAEANYKQALAAKPDGWEALGELARVYLTQKKWQELEACCKEALKLNPNHAESYRTLGNALIARGKTSEAVNAYQQALRINPKFAEAYWDMSLAMNMLVMEYQHIALELKPQMTDIGSQMNLSNAFLAKGKLDEAIAGFRRVNRLAPNYVDAYCDLGMALSGRGEFDAAREALQQAIALSPDYPKAHFCWGSVLEKQEKIDEASAAFRQVLAIDPNHAEANCAMGKLAIQQGKLDEALAFLKRALQVSPNLAVVYYHLAHAYLAKLEPELALEYVQKAIALAPQSPEVINMYGNVFLTTGRFSEAIEAFKTSLKIDPNLAWTNYYLGRAYQQDGDFVSASRYFEQALAIKPNFVDAIIGKASLLEKSREFQPAYDLLHPVVDSPAVNEQALTIFAAISRRLKKQQEAIDLLEKRLSEGNLRVDKHKMMLFHLGLIYDDLNEYDRAFKYIDLGNSLAPKKFDTEATQQQFSDLISVFSDNLSRFPRAANRSELPVFIVGMPRSGTTLVEQILDSLPQVFGAGELPDIHKIVNSLSFRLCIDTLYPQCVEALTPDLVSTLAEEHLYRLRQFSETATRVVDKLPHNFLHLGLISLLFPKARIIHCKRHPLDTCLSCYFQDFMGTHPYKYNLENLGFYYKQYEQLMAHWHKVLDIPILDVQYEDMVANQEAMSRKIVEFLGLEWNDACLSFYQSDRFAKTASYDQVRKPIYTKSVARYKNYEKHLAPLKAALGID